MDATLSPMHLKLKGGDETGSELLVPGTNKQTPGQATSQGEPPHLSGRSRVILREYFDESPSIRFPVGHTTVSFTEPQVHHLLRFLTDETLSRSFSTMGRMVIDAVRGKPTAAPSRTAQFYSGRRAQTAGTGCAGDSSGSDTEEEATLKGKDTEPSSSGETGDSSYYGKSDSVTEMDLIAKSFKRTTNVQDVPVPQTSSLNPLEGIETDTPDFSSQDATLLEVRNEMLPLPARLRPRKGRATRTSQSGVCPCEKSSFRKLDGKDPFPGLLTHSITPIWFGLTSSRKTSPSNPRAPTRY